MKVQNMTGKNGRAFTNQDIAEMDKDALEFWEQNKVVILALASFKRTER